MCKANIHIG